jgi:hypothetical protein
MVVKSILRKRKYMAALGENPSCHAIQRGTLGTPGHYNSKDIILLLVEKRAVQFSPSFMLNRCSSLYVKTKFHMHIKQQTILWGFLTSTFFDTRYDLKIFI